MEEAARRRSAYRGGFKKYMCFWEELQEVEVLLEDTA
jgi:hypothetical protein